MFRSMLYCLALAAVCLLPATQAHCTRLKTVTFAATNTVWVRQFLSSPTPYNATARGDPFSVRGGA